MFEWFRNVTHFLFGSFNGSADSTPQPIKDFIDATRVGSPQQLQSMGWLIERGSPEKFAQFCESFADGVGYIYEKYGTCPKHITIIDENRYSPHYNIASQTIFVPRTFIDSIMSSRELTQSKTHPYILEPLQMAALYGVEEAFHHHEFVCDPEYYTKYIKDLRTPDGTMAYDDNPIEGDAKVEVQQAIIDFGFQNMPTVQDLPEGDKWRRTYAESVEQTVSLGL